MGTVSEVSLHIYGLYIHKFTKFTQILRVELWERSSSDSGREKKGGKKNNSEICPRVFFIMKAYTPGERLSLRFILTEEGIPISPVASSCPVLPRGEIIKLCYCRNICEGDSPETLLPQGLRFNHIIIDYFCSPYLHVVEQWSSTIIVGCQWRIFKTQILSEENYTGKPKGKMRDKIKEDFEISGTVIL